MNRLPWVILIAAVLVATSVFALGSLRQTTGRRAERLAKEVFEKSVRAKLDDRRSRCMSAIGSPAFCDCLNADLPRDVDFQKYITITTTAGIRVDADRLATDDKQIAPRIMSTRDRCVARVFAAPPSK